MVINFSKLNCKERPSLVLRTLSGTAIQTLTGYAFDVSLDAFYREISTLTFSYPAHVDGESVPGYEKLVGMRIVDLVGVGQFIITSSGITESADKEIKTIKAQSLEYELTFKRITLTNGTYKLWDTLDSKQPDTILGIIETDARPWQIIRVDSGLVNRYRTFEVSGENILSFMKGTLEDSYQCIFDFDTYNRHIIVRDVSSEATVQPVYISLNNLAKEISIDEDAENIFTCLDVRGADGVDIRSVNPTGGNKIYNLDYFMTEENFDRATIDKWHLWKSDLESYRQQYFNITVDNALLHSQQEAEKAALAKLRGELKQVETLLAVEVEAAAQGIDGSDPERYRDEIAEIQEKISQKEDALKDIEDALAESDASLKAINDVSDFDSWTTQDEDGNEIGFTEAELNRIRLYIKEDAIEESSFVMPSVDNYSVSGTTGTSYESLNWEITITDSTITKATMEVSENTVYSMLGGTATVTVDDETVLEGSVVRGGSNSSVISLYLDSGCVTIDGQFTAVESGEMDELGETVIDGLTISSSGSDEATVYISRQLSAFSQRAVAWELYDYGREILNRVAWPSYTFSVDSGNFLAVEEFEAFRNNLQLGDSLYLNLGSYFSVLEPVLIGAKINFDQHSLSLEFSDFFSLSDSAFKLADLLEKSISAGATLDTGKYNYNAFMNANGVNGVQQYMKDSFDLAVNSLMSSEDQTVVIDSTGIRLRKWNEDKTGYDPHQIWMTESGIVFTENDWQNAALAIGTFTDGDEKKSGVIAQNIVGTLIAGENLVIQSDKKHGDIAEFMVDSEGARLYNASFDIAKQFTDDSNASWIGQIKLDPDLGIVGGKSGSLNSFVAYNEDGTVAGIKAANGTDVLTSVADISFTDKIYPMPNFWVDMEGGAYFRGSVYADNGYFKGEVQATSGKFTGIVDASDFQIDGTSVLNSDDQIKSDWLDLKGLTITNGSTTTFKVDSNGSVEINGKVTMSSDSSISWDAITDAPEFTDYSEDIDAVDDRIEGLINTLFAVNTGKVGTYIDSDLVLSSCLCGETIKLYTTNSDVSLENGHIGTISLQKTGNYAFDLQSTIGLRMQAAKDKNVFICAGGEAYTSGHPFLQLNDSNKTCFLGGGALVLSTASWGTSKPTTSIGKLEGQIYFQIV